MDNAAIVPLSGEETVKVEEERTIMELATQIDNLTQITLRQNELLESISEQIQPVIESMQNNPMFRMMFGGKK